MNELLINLQYAFGRLYPFNQEQLLMAQNAGLNVAIISFGNKPVVVWSQMLNMASQAQKDKLVELGLRDFPDTPEFLAYQNNTEIAAITTTNVLSVVADDKKVFEKLTGAQSTLLPIFFLEEGLKAAKSVCLVKIGTTKAVGSGFLIDGDLLLTNNHVLRDATIARDSRLWFDYQDNADGTEDQISEFGLDPDTFFTTSVESDFTIVKVRDNANGSANAQFGALKLKAVTTEKGDFVNIIQHPAGQKKQISLYHNAVTMSDAEVVQYLTDTLPGASGSPVFNSSWEVVALHHAGKYIGNPEPNGPKAYNEGININKVIEALK